MSLAREPDRDEAGFTTRIVVRIRPCEEADLPALEWFGAFTHHRQIIREAFDLQRAGTVIMRLAIAGGFPVGQAWLDLRTAPPKVWAVRVLDPFRGAGIGARLMTAIEAAAAARGVRRLEVGVETDNPGARRFYERLGWRITCERSDAYAYVTPEGLAVRHALHEWVLEKAI